MTKIIYNNEIITIKNNDEQFIHDLVSIKNLLNLNFKQDIVKVGLTNANISDISSKKRIKEYNILTLCEKEEPILTFDELKNLENQKMTNKVFQNILKRLK